MESQRLPQYEDYGLNTISIPCSVEKLSDKYAQIIAKASFNPFKITISPALNRGLKFSNLEHIFTSEMEQIMGRLRASGDLNDGTAVTVLLGYTFNIIESYYNHGGFVPKLMMDEILKQVYNAAKKTSCGKVFTEQLYEKFCYKMYHDLTTK